MPLSVRVGMSKALLRRPRPVRVPIDSLLLGAQVGVPADRVAEIVADPLWPSTRVVDGPHADLLRRADAKNGHLTDDDILVSAYGLMAQRCIDARGSYFGATDRGGVLALARDYVARYRGESPNGQAATDHRSRRADPVLVAPIRWSECYQVLDGHHRLALAAARGEQYAEVTAKWMPTTTPLQGLLNRMSWLEGTRELYQPVDAPELRQSWTLVRRCTDRRDKMLAFLGERGLLPPETTTYLDVASCYGWFVNEMSTAGYDARGIERDPLGPRLGNVVYGLAERAIRVGDAERLLLDEPRADVVSCFSLLHHFVLGRASVDAAELVRLLDRVTGRVLFFDTGEGHEAWFRESLAGWDAATSPRSFANTGPSTRSSTSGRTATRCRLMRTTTVATSSRACAQAGRDRRRHADRAGRRTRPVTSEPAAGATTRRPPSRGRRRLRRRAPRSDRRTAEPRDEFQCRSGAGSHPVSLGRLRAHRQATCAPELGRTTVPELSWVLLISGQDYPAMPIRQMEDELRTTPHDAFLRHFRIDDDPALDVHPWQQLCRTRYFHRRRVPGLPSLGPVAAPASVPRRLRGVPPVMWFNVSAQALGSMLQSAARGSAAGLSPARTDTRRAVRADAGLQRSAARCRQ